MIENTPRRWVFLASGFFQRASQARATAGHRSRRAPSGQGAFPGVTCGPPTSLLRQHPAAQDMARRVRQFSSLSQNLSALYGMGSHYFIAYRCYSTHNNTLVATARPFWRVLPVVFAYGSTLAINQTASSGALCRTGW